MFKLASMDKEGQANRGAWLHFTDPTTGEPAYLDKAKKKPVRVKLLGMNSNEFRLAQIEAANKAKKGGDKESELFTIEDLQKTKEDAAKLYARMTSDWQNMPAFDGSDSTEEFSKDAAFTLYLNYSDARLQASAFISDDANFMQS